jgi:L-glyceraldehyde 3-phosphate reductase
MTYVPAAGRYADMTYNRSGRSGLQLPAISLGLWHNFGENASPDVGRKICYTAFDLGITHFDLANNYGPPPGAAESFFGRMLANEFRAYRDEMIISTKAGYLMWPGPYGEWGSRKYLLASLDQSLKRMGLDYVDIFYSHRPDPDTPLEETMGALDTAVRQGKALYVGISSYRSADTAKAQKILRELGTPAIIHQPSYSIVNRWTEQDRLLDTLEKEGMGCIVFSPLAQGLLTDRYLKGVPADSRAGQKRDSWREEFLSEANLKRVQALNEVARNRGQTLAQMAISWVLRDKRMTSALIGASRPEQVINCVGALENRTFSSEELAAIDAAGEDESINIWKQRR